MSSYMTSIPIIQKLIDKHQLGINLKKRLVIMDNALFCMFAPRGSSTYDIKKSDKRMAAFFDKVIAFMNFELGRMRIKDFIDPKKEQINFHVTSEHRRYVDDNGMPLPAHLQISFETILIGKYKDGKIDYATVENYKNNS